MFGSQTPAAGRDKCRTPAVRPQMEAEVVGVCRWGAIFGTKNFVTLHT